MPTIRLTEEEAAAFIERWGGDGKPTAAADAIQKKNARELAKLQKPSEAEFATQVIDLAHMTGWMAAHFRPAQTKSGRWITAVQGDGKGFVDLVLVRCREPRHCPIFVELKIPPNGLTVEQEEWKHMLLLNGAEYYVWTPDDWPQIERVLTCGGKP